MGLSEKWWPLPRSRYLAIAAVVVLSLALIEITDFVELPFESQLAALGSSSLVSTSSLIASVGARAEVRKEGLFSKSSIPPYTATQLKAALRIDSQSRWTELGYRPEFDAQAACEEIAKWYRKEPWATEAA